MVKFCIIAYFLTSFVYRQEEKAIPITFIYIHMKKMSRLLLIAMMLLSHHLVVAQKDTLPDNSYYFDDGGISERKNIFKVNILAIVSGDLPFYYERILGKSFGLEIGAGLLLPYYLPDLPNLFTEEYEVENPDFGHSLWIHPKYYIQPKAPEFGYFGIQLRRRHYNQNNQSIIFSDLTINYGFQLFLGKRFIFDYNVGIGSSFKTQKSLNIKNEKSGLAIPIGIKLGILL